MVVWFNQHLTKNGLHEDAYKQNHNTETVLLKVQNDLLMAVNTYGGAVFILHDLSAAFDTIDHTILLQWLHKLEMRCCIRLVQILFELANTIRCYRWPTIITSKSVLWSASGISTYTTSLGAIERKYQLNSYIYADNTHMYMVFKLNNAQSLPLVISNIQNCVIDIKSWMTANMWQLNMDKTEVLVLMNKSLRNPITMNKIKIASIVISTASSVRNLGAIFDSALSSEASVNSICTSV